MSTSADTLDLGLDLRAERSRRRQRFMRVAVPVLTVVVLIAVMAGISFYLFQANRTDARVLTDDLLRELERRIVTEVVAFLEPASVMVSLETKVLKGRALLEHRESLAEPFTIELLKSYPQLARFNFADPRGTFIMVTRIPDGSIHTKLMDRRGEGVETRWIRRDTDGRVISVDRDPDDTYDPRTRTWYQGAAESGELYWTDVYVFFSDQRPGITAALPMLDESGELTAVISIDIALEALSDFLGSLEIGIHGRAMIIDENGVLVAYPVLDEMLEQTDRGLQRVHIEQLADPVINRAFDRFRVDGPGQRELVVEDHRYIATAASLEPVLGRDWTLFIVAPEEDFIGFVAENNLRGLYMAGAILVLASLLAGLLVSQGLRADRNERLVHDRQKQLEAQSRAFSGLAAQAALFDSSDDSAVATLTETVAGSVGSRRISVWHLSADSRRLVCEDSFDRETRGHTGGMELTAEDLPKLFESIIQGEELVATDAAADPRTAELHRTYLRPLGCRALASMPIVRGEQTVGVIWLEDDENRIGSGSEDLAFARAVANLLALRMRSDESAGTGSSHTGEPRRATEKRAELTEPMRRTELVTGRRAEAFQARIARERGEGATIGAQIFEDVTVMVVRFTDYMSLAAAVAGEDRIAADHLVERLETMAEEHGVEYLKLLGDQIVCAAGFTGEPERSAQIMADAALNAMDHCARLFARLERRLDFRIGLDSGPVMGSAVGRGQSVFNIWGEAVLTASRMAETGVAGQIQATESTYRHLRDHFLFRARGSYYLKDFGEFTTYLLTGRL